MEFKDLLREIEVPRELMVEAAKTTIKEIRAAQIKHRWRVAYATAIPVLGGAILAYAVVTQSWLAVAAIAFLSVPSCEFCGAVKFHKRYLDRTKPAQATWFQPA